MKAKPSSLSYGEDIDNELNNSSKESFLKGEICFKRHVSVYSTLLHLGWNIKHVQSRFGQCLVLIPLRVAADRSIYCQAGHLHCGAAEEASFTQCSLTEIKV